LAAPAGPKLGYHTSNTLTSVWRRGEQALKILHFYLLFARDPQ